MPDFNRDYLVSHLKKLQVDQTALLNNITQGEKALQNMKDNAQAFSGAIQSATVLLQEWDRAEGGEKGNGVTVPPKDVRGKTAKGRVSNG